MGRVALIDAQRDVLIVDPDIDTLNCYAEDNRISRSALPERIALWQDSSYGLTVKKERSGKSVLVRGIESVSHTELFDALADIAEEFCGLPITIGIDLSAAGDGFDERIEAIFRSAVYGNFSLMLENYRSESDIFLARDRLSGVFCALESEGREFNGYLRKGLLLSAPIWLMQNIAHGKADFICFDFDRLTAALLGLELCELQSAEFPKRELFRAWESYLLSFAPSCELCAEAESLGNSPIFREWCAIAGIDKIFGAPP